MTQSPPQPAIRDAVLSIVTGLERPVSAATVFKRRKQENLRAARLAIESALEDLVAAGRIHAHPPTRPGGAVLYHRLSALDYTMQRLAAVLAGEAPLTARKLSTVAGRPYAPFVDEALARLVAAGRIRPTRFLSARHRAQITAITEALNSLRPTPLDLASVLAFFDGVGPTAARAPTVDREVTEELLVQWYADDLPRIGGLRAVPVPWTWTRYEAWCVSQNRRPHPELFQRHLLDMATRAVVGLTPHEHEGALTEDVVRVLPRTPAGYLAYYWTILR